MTTEAIPPKLMPPPALGITAKQAKVAAGSGALVRMWPLVDAPCRPFAGAVREVRNIGRAPFVLLDGHWSWVPCAHCEMVERAP